MATVFSTDFTGVDGGAWPAPWTLVEGSSSLLSNEGVLQTPASAWATAAMRANQVLGDGTFTVKTRVSDLASGASAIDVRYNVDTGDGYRILLGWYYSGFEVLRVDSWATTSIAAAGAIDWQAGTDYLVKVEVNGSQIRAKYWVDGTQEPSTWTVTVTDATYGTGDTMLRSTANGTGVTMIGVWDDAVLTDTVEYVDTTAPAVSLIDPTPIGQTRGYEHVRGVVRLSVSASDDVAVRSVSVYEVGSSAADILIGVASESPYQVIWDTLAVKNGSHVLYAVATDTSGRTATSDTVTVMVNNNGIWAPKNGRAWPVTARNA